MLQQRQVLAYEADELGVTPLMFAAAGGLENPMNHESLKAGETIFQEKTLEKTRSNNSLKASTSSLFGRKDSLED